MLLRDTIGYIGEKELLPELLSQVTKIYWLTDDCSEFQDRPEVIPVTSFVGLSDIISIYIATEDIECLKSLKTTNYPLLFKGLKAAVIRWCEIQGYNLHRVTTPGMYKFVALKEGLTLTTSWLKFYELGKEYRILAKNKEAYKLLKEALQLCSYSSQQYKIYEELVIVTYYTDHKAEGLAYGDKVVLNSSTPWHIRNNSLLNQSWYMTPLPGERKVISVNCDLEYYSSSASITATTEGYTCLVRTVDYIISPDGTFKPPPTVNTINYIVKLDHEFQTISQLKLIDRSNTIKYPVWIKGMEDVRIYGNNRFLCIYPEISPYCIYRVCEGAYDDNGNVTEVTTLLKPEEEKLPLDKLGCEKNWLPYIYEGKTYFIYSLQPLIIYEYKNHKLSLHCKKTLSTKYLNDFRGSGVPIAYKNGLLFTIHQVYHSNTRHYYHRFVWLSYDFETLKFSKPFYFEIRGTEYTLGHCHSAKGLVICYSVRDGSTNALIIDYKLLDEYLGLS